MCCNAQAIVVSKFGYCTYRKRVLCRILNCVGYSILIFVNFVYYLFYIARTERLTKWLAKWWDDWDATSISLLLRYKQWMPQFKDTLFKLSIAPQFSEEFRSPHAVWQIRRSRISRWMKRRIECPDERTEGWKQSGSGRRCPEKIDLWSLINPSLYDPSWAHWSAREWW